VAANGRLRERFAAEMPVPFVHPPPRLCTDNAAMIASAARFAVPMLPGAYLGLDAYATGERL
jgi:N6-L-threonylcarbamoyladenine synthase